MHRLSVLFLALSFAILTSCAGPATTTQQSQASEQQEEVEEYPSWYGSQTVVHSDSHIHAYATAVDDDSAGAVRKAVQWAESEIRSSVSDRLEAIRSEAAVEYGSEYGLDSSRFLIALRKADNAVPPLVRTKNTEVKTVEGYSSKRSFAEISVSKKELIERIGKRLAGYEKAWNAMKESKAFKNF